MHQIGRPERAGLQDRVIARWLVSVPFQRFIKGLPIRKHIDAESLPYIFISLGIVLSLILIGVFIPRMQREANTYIAQEKENVGEMIYSEGERIRSREGFLVRKRDGMILFYDTQKQATVMIPQVRILSFEKPVKY